MKTVFADAFYWAALANPKDEWHPAAMRAGVQHPIGVIITTDEVLDEFLAHFCDRGAYWRNKAVELLRKIQKSPNVRIVPQTRDSFLRGLQLYEARPDKEYSLTDCISMETMREHKLTEVLTHDHHFRQEGFTLLLTDKNA